jgi:hypothetical protein
MHGMTIKVMTQVTVLYEELVHVPHEYSVGVFNTEMGRDV